MYVPVGPRHTDECLSKQIRNYETLYLAGCESLSARKRQKNSKHTVIHDLMIITG